MKPRDAGWITASAKNLNELRFAYNFAKLPTNLSSVKRGECLDQSAYYSASNIVDMDYGQRSRNEAKIIHPTFD